jgi:hypothetical protein
MHYACLMGPRGKLTLDRAVLYSRAKATIDSNEFGNEESQFQTLSGDSSLQIVDICPPICALEII